MESSAEGGTAYQQYCLAAQQLKSLKEEHSRLSEKGNLLKQIIAYLLVTLPNIQQSTALQQLQIQCKSVEEQQLSKVPLALYKQNLTEFNNNRPMRSNVQKLK